MNQDPFNNEPQDVDQERRDIDQEIRLNQLRQEIEDKGGSFYSGADCPPELEEAFMRNILAYENASDTTHMDLLQRDGVVLPPPAEVTDEEMPAMLLRFIDALAHRRVFLSSTDHLSDRELYTYLWTEGCREDTPDLPPECGMNCHLDVLGGCSEEDINLQLMYYADDAWRADWIQQFPDYELPEKKKPPYDRDRFLPQAYPGQHAENEDSQ